VAAAGIYCAGCAGDSPTQGTPATKLEMSQSIDKSLDDMAALPIESRGMAMKKLEKPIQTKGSPAQKVRWTELIKGVKPMMPLRRTAVANPGGN